MLRAVIGPRFLRICEATCRKEKGQFFILRRADHGASASSNAPGTTSRPCFPTPLLASAEQFTGKVIGISDGDTISVLREGKAVKGCLHGGDTREKAQAFGTQARQFTGELVFQQTVTVAIRDTDRYGRVVGEVLLPDGRSLNQELVKAGMAWWYRQYAPNDTTLAQLEAEAWAAKRGLWADVHPVPPWQWRKQPRESAQTSEPVAAAMPL